SGLGLRRDGVSAVSHHSNSSRSQLPALHIDESNALRSEHETGVPRSRTPSSSHYLQGGDPEDDENMTSRNERSM
ncbi:hypothetical protein PISMIDRAFT_671187, partial [Pisolithus microcarpus 441]